jgi:hypothetical protein
VPSASFTRQGGIKEGGRSLMRKIMNRVTDTEPVHEGQHTSHGVTAVGSDEVEAADADEGAHSTSLTLFVGEAAAQATSEDAQASVGQAAGEVGLLCFDRTAAPALHACAHHGAPSLPHRRAYSASNLWRGYASTPCTRRCTCSSPSRPPR